MMANTRTRDRRAWAVLAAVGAVSACAGALFGNEQGTFVFPDYTVPADRAAIPPRLECGDVITIYAAHVEIVNNCRGFAGARDFSNRVCATAAGEAGAAARRPQCPTACPKRIEQIYRGWDCKLDTTFNTLDARCAVELSVRCPVED